ncbi:hypothetical protein GTY64_31500 [Streptomyces sp. SID8376]|uniref:hypothetical protein n=1 Tax=unclassified Streptomyces TaxID=2593676 RepID=UPI000365467B|nr:hypothetical protein [Streptomyces sp. SID8376]
MGAKPSAAIAAAHETSSHTGDVTPAHGRFALPHALVIITCIITAAVIAPRAVTVGDVLILVGGSGLIGAVIVLAVMTSTRRSVGRFGRLVRAYFTSGS